MLFLRDKVVLITGGTGSLGQALVPILFENKVKKIIIYSRGEHAQVQMERIFPRNKFSIRYLLGDVRDRHRLYRAFDGVHYVIHCAAIKHVDKAQSDPFEAVQTNVVGAQHIIDAAIDRKVMKVLAVSSDKAVNPCNLYGASKLCADFMFVAANVYSPQSTRFGVVRFGNFWGSSGSFIELIEKIKTMPNEKIPITHPGMTRFFITLETAAEKVLEALENFDGGEIMVPKMEAYRIEDLARQLCPNREVEYIGIRDGEKMHEELLTVTGDCKTHKYGDWYITYPPGKKGKGILVPSNFKYCSGEMVEL